MLGSIVREAFMKIILLKVFLFGFFVFLLPSCFSECRRRAGSKEYRELATSITASNAAAIERFNSFTVDKQITVFLYARDCADDPRIRPMLIRNGEKRIPAVIERIETEQKIWDKGELVGILIAINNECRCILPDSEIIKKLERIGEELDNDPDIPADYTYTQMYKRSVESLKSQLNEP